MPQTFPCPNPVCTQLINAEAVQGAASLTCPACGTKLDFRPRTAAPRNAPARAATPKPPLSAPKTVPPPTKPVAATPTKPAAKPPVAAPIRPAKPAVPLASAVKSARPAPPPLPAKPVTAAKPPLAAPVVPMATPITASPAAAPNLAFSSQPDMVLTSRRQRRSLPGWLVAALLVIPVFGGLCAVIFGFTQNWFKYGPSEDQPNEEKHGLTQQGNFRITPPGKPWQQDKALQLSIFFFNDTATTE